MANHTLSGLTGNKESGGQGAGSNAVKEGLLVNQNGPTSHTELLDFYFGHPSSVVKTTGAPKQSQW